MLLARERAREVVENAELVRFVAHEHAGGGASRCRPAGGARAAARAAPFAREVERVHREAGRRRHPRRTRAAGRAPVGSRGLAWHTARRRSLTRPWSRATCSPRLVEVADALEPVDALRQRELGPLRDDRTRQRGRPARVELLDGLGLEGLLGQEHPPALRPPRPRRLPRVQARRQPRRAAAWKLEEDQAQRLRGLTGARSTRADPDQLDAHRASSADDTDDARQPSRSSWRPLLRCERHNDTNAVLGFALATRATRIRSTCCGRSAFFGRFRTLVTDQARPTHRLPAGSCARSSCRRRSHVDADPWRDTANARDRARGGPRPSRFNHLGPGWGHALRITGTVRRYAPWPPARMTGARTWCVPVFASHLTSGEPFIIADRPSRRGSSALSSAWASDFSVRWMGAKPVMWFGRVAEQTRRRYDYWMHSADARERRIEVTIARRQGGRAASEHGPARLGFRARGRWSRHLRAAVLHSQHAPHDAERRWVAGRASQRAHRHGRRCTGFMLLKETMDGSEARRARASASRRCCSETRRLHLLVVGWHHQTLIASDESLDVLAGDRAI